MSIALIIIIFLLLSAFFSGAEIAFVSASKLGVEIKRDEGSRRGRILGKFFDKPDDFLGAMLVGNNIALVVFTYFMAELAVEIGDSLRRLQVSMIQNQSLRIDYEEPIELSLGLPWNVPVNLDVNVMLDGIKPEQTNELMSATIGDNISAAITGN